MVFFVKDFAVLTTGCLLFASSVHQAFAFDNSRSDNLAVYWGQNSYGATNGNQAGWQKRLSAYCQDDAINAIPLAFLHVFFSVGGLPEINMANICNSVDQGAFAGTNLANCQFLQEDIKTCQARGKIVTLSLGGATGAAGFTSDAQAQTFADTIWNLFLGGSSSTRPFGNAVLDGVDLDIEGGSGASLPAFVTRIRSHASGASKKYYVTAAPQCVFPDAALGNVINAVGFDAIYVQFYNNWCGLQNFANVNAWNFGVWDTWAKTVSPNKSVKIYIGAPAAASAAGSGYVDVNTLANIAKTTRSQYSSFGGVMLWDASQAYANNRFDVAIKNALGGGSVTTTTSHTTTPTTTHTTTPTTTTSPGGGGCSGVAAWNSGSVYVGGQQVSYGGHLWTAKWWTQADTPGGAAGVWTDNGACFAKSVPTSNLEPVTAAAEAKATPAAEAKKAPAVAFPKSSGAVTSARQEAAPVFERLNSRFFKF